MHLQYSNTKPKPLTPGSDTWRTMITGSKISTILGINPWQSPARLWLEMRGDIDPEPANDAMLRGTIQEDSILEWFFTAMRPDIRKVAGETTFHNPRLPWAAANPDAVAVEDGRTIFIEAKSVARDGGVWGEPGTDQIPLYYYVQVLWAMHMTHHDDGDQVTRCHVVKHGPYVDQYDSFVVDYDHRAAMEVERRAHSFWLSLADDDGCPPPSELPGEHKVFAKLHPDIDRDFEWEISHELASAYIAARDEAKASAVKESRVKAEILRVMGTARTATCNGVTVAYRRPTKSGVSLYPPQRTVTIEDITPTTEKES